MSDAAKKQPKRPPLKARPQKDVDHEALRREIMTRFSETLKYLAR